MSGQLSTSIDISELNRNKLNSVFNKKIFALLGFVKVRFDKNTAERVIRLAKIAKRIDHEVIITTIGPYLLKYRELISSRNHSAFSPELFESESNKYSDSGDNTKTKELAFDMFLVIHTAVKTMNETEFEDVYKCADQLIDIYIEFCIRSRTEAKK